MVTVADLGEVVVKRHRPSERIGATVGMGILVPFLLLAIIMILTERTSPLYDAVGVALLGAGVWWLMGAVRGAGLWVGEGGVVVRNWFVRFVVPWSAVSGV